MRKIFFACLLLLNTVNSYAAQICPAYIQDVTPTSRYTVDTAKGTVSDGQTGLMWQQCSLGQTASNGTCTGNATVVNWQGALGAGEDSVLNGSTVGGYDNWRLPNQKELRSIVATNCYTPSVNIGVFPSTLLSFYWSSSPYAADNGEFALGVTFDFGTDRVNRRSTSDGYVRLVR
jgi:hypothetical protein